MNPLVKEIADALNGSEYGFEPSKELIARCRAERIVIAFGHSDDLLEFRGAVYDELGAYEGTTAHFNRLGLVTNDCGNEECPYFQGLLKKATKLHLKWQNGYPNWIFETNIPHAKFDVLEDDNHQCEAIVFCLDDIPLPDAEPKEPNNASA